MQKLRSFVVSAVLAAAVSALAQSSGTDPLSGTWTGDWGPSASDRNPVTVELKLDGAALSGTINPGANAVALQKATFDPSSKAVHFEADAKGRDGKTLHYVVEGKLSGQSMTGTWQHDDRKGDFKITKK
jgi:hypothetical protein